MSWFPTDLRSEIHVLCPTPKKRAQVFWLATTTAMHFPAFLRLFLSCIPSSMRKPRWVGDIPVAFFVASIILCDLSRSRLFTNFVLFRRKKLFWYAGCVLRQRVWFKHIIDLDLVGITYTQILPNPLHLSLTPIDEISKMVSDKEVKLGWTLLQSRWTSILESVRYPNLGRTNSPLWIELLESWCSYTFLRSDEGDQYS